MLLDISKELTKSYSKYIRSLFWVWVISILIGMVTAVLDHAVNTEPKYGTFTIILGAIGFEAYWLWSFLNYFEKYHKETIIRPYINGMGRELVANFWFVFFMIAILLLPIAGTTILMEGFY